MSQKRIYMWYSPRTTSTAFFRAMTNKSNTKTFLDPFNKCYMQGPERLSPRYKDTPVEEEFTYNNSKQLLEADYPGCTTIFAKDADFAMTERPNIKDGLPKGYIHTLLMRNPQKCMLSWYKIIGSGKAKDWDYFIPYEVDYKNLYTMYEVITKELGQEAIIVDSDDLLLNPEPMMRLYCEKVGIEFEDSMIHWKHPFKDMDAFEEYLPFHRTLMESRSFGPPSNIDKKAVDELPAEYKQLMESNMDYYNKLYPLRLIPQ